jgi:hypothetical protein
MEEGVLIGMHLHLHLIHVIIITVITITTIVKHMLSEREFLVQVLSLLPYTMLRVQLQ